jgi:hypothetical protein
MQREMIEPHDRRVVKALLDGIYHRDEVVSLLPERIEEIAQRQRVIRNKFKFLDELKKNYEERAAAVNKEIAAIRNECGHLVSEYHADPAGGSDSFTTCLLCGDVLL